MNQPQREHFNYSWPGDAKVLGVEVSGDALCITFDRFTVSLDDPWNTSSRDVIIGRSTCKFISPLKIEFRMWADNKSFRLDEDISKLIGCTLEDSGDMPSTDGHFFELTGFCETEWFELRIFSNAYEL